VQSNNQKPKAAEAYHGMSHSEKSGFDMTGAYYLLPKKAKRHIFTRSRGTSEGAKS